MKKTVFTLLAISLCAAAWAQSHVNPAETAGLEYGFVRIGEFNTTTRNNVEASAFLFPKGDKLVTGLHSSVNTDDFLGGLEAVNSIYSQTDYNLVSYGWKSSKGFQTVSVGARVNYGLSVPREIFRILKEGTAQSPYDLSALKAFGNLYGEIAYGYSIPLTDNLYVGGRVKLLVGLNSADVVARRFELTTTDEQYSLDLDTDIDLTNRNKKAGQDDDGYLDYTSFTGKGKLGAPTGAGLALDMGLIWKPFRGFTVDASIQDAGGILWYYGNAGRSSGSYTFEGLKDLTVDEMDQEHLGTRLKETGEEVLGVIKPKSVEGVFKVKGIPLAARLGASYALPFWERLSVNASGIYTGYSFCAPYWEARGGASVDYPGIAQLQLSAGSGTCGFVYAIQGSVNFLSFKLYAKYENGTGGTIPYESTPLKANNKCLVVGLDYLIK